MLARVYKNLMFPYTPSLPQQCSHKEQLFGRKTGPHANISLERRELKKMNAVHYLREISLFELGAVIPL